MTFSGALGARIPMTAETGAEGAEVPAPLVVVAVKVTFLPSVSPVIVQVGQGEVSCDIVTTHE